MKEHRCSMDTNRALWWGKFKIQNCNPRDKNGNNIIWLVNPRDENGNSIIWLVSASYGVSNSDALKITCVRMT